MGFIDIFRVGELIEQNENLQKSYTELLESNSLMMHEYNDLRESYDREISGRGFGWQTLTEIQGTNTDFDLTKHHKMQEKAKEAFFYSPAAKRFVTYSTSYITGKDFEITSEIESIQELIDSCVKNPKNKWKRQVREWTHRFLIEGEVFITIHLGADGSAILRETDPYEIKEVIRDPDDDQEPILYKRMYTPVSYVDGMEQPVGSEKKTEYILAIDKEMSDVKKLNIDSTVTSRISKNKRIQHVKTLSFGNRKRGFSPLLNILYYLQRIRDDIDEKMRLKKYSGAYYLDVEVDGSSADVASEASKAQYKRPPKSGSTLVHNKTVKYNLMQPKIDYDNDNKSIEPILQQIVIGTGMPEWMLVGMANMYKAGAQEQSGPFAKVIEDAQELWGDEYTKLMTFLITYKLSKNEDRAYFNGLNTNKGKMAQIDSQLMVDEPKINENGELISSGKKKPFWEFITVQFPEIITRDPEKESKAIQNDIANGLVSKQTASIARGYDYDQEKILMTKEAEEEKARNPLMNGELDLTHDQEYIPESEDNEDNEDGETEE